MTRRIRTGLVMGLALVPAMALAQAPAGQSAAPPRPPLTLTSALGTKVDVPPGADAWATRTSVYDAMPRHVLGMAVYVGLFRRPQ